MTKRTVFLVALTLCAMGFARDALACPVCYGDSDDGFVQGAQWATFLMVGVTYSMLSGGVAAFVLLRRRAIRSGQLNPVHDPDVPFESASPRAAEPGAAP